MKDYKNIGRRLKLVREYLNISQEEFAESLGLVQGQMSYIETGKFKIQLEAVLELYKKYRISIYDLSDINIKITDIVRHVNNASENPETITNDDYKTLKNQLAAAEELIEKLLSRDNYGKDK